MRSVVPVPLRWININTVEVNQSNAVEVRRINAVDVVRIKSR